MYVSPYARTQETLQGLLRGLGRGDIPAAREDHRLREREVNGGNLTDEVVYMQHIKGALPLAGVGRHCRCPHARGGRSPPIAAMKKTGRFFYRFPNGESLCDVCTRALDFLRDAVFAPSGGADTVVLVTHHNTTLLLLKELCDDPSVPCADIGRADSLLNAELAVLDLVPGGPAGGRPRYALVALVDPAVAEAAGPRVRDVSGQGRWVDHLGESRHNANTSPMRGCGPKRGGASAEKLAGVRKKL